MRSIQTSVMTKRSSFHKCKNLYTYLPQNISVPFLLHAVYIIYTDLLFPHNISELHNPSVYSMSTETSTDV